MKRKRLKVSVLEGFRVTGCGTLEQLIAREGTPPVWAKVNTNSKNSEGYVRVWDGFRRLMYHRIIWEISMGPIPPGSEIDHINGVRDDNRIENLRVVTDRGNSSNMECHRNGHSVGTARDRHGKWTAKITINDSTIYLGAYGTQEEASTVYKNGVALLGQFVNKDQFFELVTGRKKMERKQDEQGRIYHVPVTEKRKICFQNK